MTDAAIQAIFSMSFFHYVPPVGDRTEQWAVSPKFWIYWAVTVPVTIMTVAIWLSLQYWHSSHGSVTSRHREEPPTQQYRSIAKRLGVT